MIPLAAAAGAAKGLFQVVGSLFGGRKRRREQRRAKKEFNTLKQQYTDLDTSNLYLGQENMFEDMTVNQEESKFLAEQENQSLANILSSNREAAGGSGIAAMSQALFNQQTKNLATSAISIGKQERENQLLSANAATNIQTQEIEGAVAARELDYEKTETLLGMSGERYAAANKARTDATSALFTGLGEIAGGALSSGLIPGLKA